MAQSHFSFSENDKYPLNFHDFFLLAFCCMKLKVLYVSLFLYKSHFFKSFVPLFASILNVNKASNNDLSGNAWFGQDANISSKNAQSTMK